MIANKKVKIRWTFTYFVFGLCLLNINCKKDNNIKSIAEDFRVSNKIPGMAIAIVKPDTILEMFTLGYKIKGKSKKIEINDRFHIGSNTKSMTSFVAGYLVEKGKIDWDTKFIELFPDWKNKIDSQYLDLTLGILLSHRGRIQGFSTEEEYDSIDIQKQTKSIQRNEFNEYVLNTKPIVPNNVGYHYSNAGYSVAAQMLEKASGQSWEELMIQVFNNDLNLNIGFSWPNKIDHNEPWGHRYIDGKFFPCSPEEDYNLDWIEPGGDVNLSLPDYCKFIQLNLKGITGEDNYLKASTYDLLHNDKNGPVYAYGWANDHQIDRKYSFHFGSAGTFLVNVVIEKTEPIAYIIMQNSDSPKIRKTVLQLRQRMENLYYDNEVI